MRELLRAEVSVLVRCMAAAPILVVPTLLVGDWLGVTPGPSLRYIGMAAAGLFLAANAFYVLLKIARPDLVELAGGE